MLTEDKGIIDLIPPRIDYKDHLLPKETPREETPHTVAFIRELRAEGGELGYEGGSLEEYVRAAFKQKQEDLREERAAQRDKERSKLEIERLREQHEFELKRDTQGNFPDESPYQTGHACTKCASGIGECYSNLCIACENTHKYCGTNPGWYDASTCSLADYAPALCPVMCGLCNEGASAVIEATVTEKPQIPYIKLHQASLPHHTTYQFQVQSPKRIIQFLSIVTPYFNVKMVECF
ncbi:uncharacterized protein LOC144356542 [Saccoglossus kowalevskii]